MAKSLETVYLKDGQVDVAHYHDLALQKQKEHAKFLATLKKKKPKHLDQLVQKVHNEVFEQIDCTKCANCCKSLGPLFTAFFKPLSMVIVAKNVDLTVFLILLWHSKTIF